MTFKSGYPFPKDDDFSLRASKKTDKIRAIPEFKVINPAPLTKEMKMLVGTQIRSPL
jgi:hypothetical protein